MTLPRRYLRPLVVSLTLGMTLYLALAILADLDAVADAMVTLGADGWSLVIGLALTGFLLRFLRWQLYLGRLGYRVPVGASLAYYLGAFAFTTTPGKAGEAVKSLYLKRHGVRYADSLAALFTELFLDVVVVALLALAGGLGFEQTRPAMAAMGMLILLALPLIHSPRLHGLLAGWGERLGPGRLKQGVQAVVDLLRASSLLMRSGLLYLGILLGIAAWGATGLGFVVIVQHLGIDLPLTTAISIYALSLLAGAAAFIVGGLGSTEAVMGLLLALSGASASLALSATFVFRLGTLWFAIVLGILIILGLELLLRGDDDDPNQ